MFGFVLDRARNKHHFIPFHIAKRTVGKAEIWWLIKLESILLRGKFDTNFLWGLIYVSNMNRNHRMIIALRKWMGNHQKCSQKCLLITFFVNIGTCTSHDFSGLNHEMIVNECFLRRHCDYVFNGSILLIPKHSRTYMFISVCHK